MYKRNPISLSRNISAKNLKGRRVWGDTFQLRKGKKPPRILYSANYSFRIKWEIRSFPGKQKLNEFITTKSIL